MDQFEQCYWSVKSGQKMWRFLLKLCATKCSIEHISVRLRLIIVELGRNNIFSSMFPGSWLFFQYGHFGARNVQLKINNWAKSEVWYSKYIISMITKSLSIKVFEPLVTDYYHFKVQRCQNMGKKCEKTSLG